MKKIIILIIAFLAVTTGNAQLIKGSAPIYFESKASLDSWGAPPNLNYSSELAFTTDTRTLWKWDGVSAWVKITDWADITGIPSGLADGDDVNDADFDPTNEIQILTISNDTLYLSSGGFAVIPSGGAVAWADVTSKPAGFADDTDDVNDADADPTNELQSWSTLPGIPANIDEDSTDDFDGAFSSLTGVPAGLADGDDVNDADADPTNELQSWSTLPGIPANIDEDSTDDFDGAFSSLTGVPAGLADGDDVNDADADPTNELQIASEVNITDSGGYYTGSTVEASLDELGEATVPFSTASTTTGVIDWGNKIDGVRFINMTGLSTVTISFSNAVVNGKYTIIFQNADDSDTITWTTDFINMYNGTGLSSGYLAAKKRAFQVVYNGTNFYLLSSY